MASGVFATKVALYANGSAAATNTFAEEAVSYVADCTAGAAPAGEGTQRLVLLRERWCSYAKLFARICRRQDNDIARDAEMVVRALGLQACDIRVLRHFQGAVPRAKRSDR